MYFNTFHHRNGDEKNVSYLVDQIFFINRCRSDDNFNEKLPHKITNVTQINDQ